MSRTPNYITTQEITMDFGPQDRRVIPAGSSVRPVEEQYLPKHIVDKWRCEYTGEVVPKDKVFVYCRYGFWPVKRTSIREY